MIVNIYGPPATGKTRNSQNLKDLFACDSIRDDGQLDTNISPRRGAKQRRSYLASNPLKDGELILTHEPIGQDNNPRGIPIIYFHINDALNLLPKGGAA